MIVTIDLSTELVAEVRERIREGDTEAMRRLIADAATPAVETMLRQPPVRYANGLTAEEIKRMSEELWNKGAARPTLSEEAFTRESFYEESH